MGQRTSKFKTFNILANLQIFGFYIKQYTKPNIYKCMFSKDN